MVFLIFFSRTHPPPAVVLLSHNQPVCPRTAFFSITPTPILPRRIHTNSRRWDSNAETFRSRNFDFNSTDTDDDDDDDDTNQWLEDFIDGVWIFKVFRSFGWMLPAIISSLLLASGPKAFLMALAIPIGQSALSLLFQTVWGWPNNKTRRRGKTKRKPRSSAAASYSDIDNQQEEEDLRKRGGGYGYQTWVSGDAGLNDTKSNGSKSSFGGWEELDTKTWSKTNGKPKTSKSKLSTRETTSQTPLLLRLLIAVFPFLGSWTRML